jgi:hypothetical protein
MIPGSVVMLIAGAANIMAVHNRFVVARNPVALKRARRRRAV